MDKEIIINDVNVSNCSNLGSQYNCTVKANMPCKMFPNCYFKQLQRKTAECEKYEQRLHKISDYIKKNCNHCQAVRYGGCEKCEFEQMMDIIKSVKDSK